MGVVSDACTDASTLVLTGFDEVYDLLSIHPGQLTHQVHHRQAPVDTAHPQVFWQRVLLRQHKRDMDDHDTRSCLLRSPYKRALPPLRCPWAEAYYSAASRSDCSCTGQLPGVTVWMQTRKESVALSQIPNWINKGGGKKTKQTSLWILHKIWTLYNEHSKSFSALGSNKETVLFKFADQRNKHIILCLKLKLHHKYNETYLAPWSRWA